MNRDRSVSAMFNPDTAMFTLSINIAGTGTGAVGYAQSYAGYQCTNQCSVTAASGSVFNLGAVSDPGSKFSDWSGAPCGAGMIDCSFTLTSDLTVVATFTSINSLPPDFSLSASAITPAAVNPGTPASSVVTLGALNGFKNAAALTCSVSPVPQLAPQCSLSPVSLDPGKSSTLQVTTTGPLLAAAVLPARSGTLWPLQALGWPLAGVAIWRIGSARRRHQRVLDFLLWGPLLVGFVFQTRCRSYTVHKTGGGTPAGTYTITVVATSGSIQHSTTVNLTVQ